MSEVQPDEHTEQVSSDTLPMTASQVEEVWNASEAEKLDTITRLLDLNARYALFRVKVIAEFFLENINECQRIGCNSKHTSVWVDIARKSFEIESKADAIASIRTSIETNVSKLGADNAVKLIDFLNNTYFLHFRLFRFCMRESRPTETLEATIETNLFRPTPSFAGAVPVTDERARAAFRRAETLATGGTLWKRVIGN